MKKSASSRRSFIKKGVLAIATAVAVPLSAKEVKPTKTIKMLTADGKLVEVDAEMVKKASRKKVGSREILDWRTIKG